MNIKTELKYRKINERLRYFEPQAPPYNDQHAVLYSSADERWVFGGNRSGKTEIGVADCCLFATGKHPVRSEDHQPPVKIRYCAPKWRDNVLEVLFPKFKEMLLDKDLRGGQWQKAWSEKEHTLYLANGSTVQFKSYEEDLNTFGGKDLDAVYQDEHCSKKIYDENAARLVDRDGFFMSTMTPEKGVTWEEDHVLSKTPDLDVQHWFFNSDNNPYLSVEGLKKMKAKIKDPILLQAKIEGLFVPLTGRVIPQWNPDVHIIPDRKLHENAQRVFMIDLHPKAPSAAMWAAWEPCEFYGMKLIIYRTAKEFKTIPEWKTFIQTQSAGEKITDWMGDETIVEEGPDIRGNESLIIEFNEEPNRIPLVQVNKGKGTFTAGIFKLRDWLSVDPVNPGRCRVYMFESCNWPIKYINGKPHGSLPWEMKQYVFRPEQKADEESLRERVRNVNNHFIDDVRYIVHKGFVDMSQMKSKVVLPGNAKPGRYTGMVG